MYYYTAYSHSFQSEIPLPEFVEITPCRADIEISKDLREHDFDRTGEILHASRIASGVAFDWDAIGKYEICAGRTIRFFLRKNTSDEIARIPLFGIALAAVLQQNNLLVLHGTAIEINGKAVVLLGCKGQGKSTLAAALINRRHKLISDDVTAISINAAQIAVLPGVPILKLWPNTLRELGLGADAYRVFYPGISKRLCTLKSQFCKNSLPVGAICVLGCGDALQMDPVAGIQKLLHLSAFHYFADFRHAFSSERQKRVFEQNSALAKQAAMFKFTRFRDLKFLDAACVMVEGLMR